MWKHKQFSLRDIGIEGMYSIESIPSIPLDRICIVDAKLHVLLSSFCTVRCSFTVESQVDRGSYGNLFIVKRNGETVLAKQPRLAEMNLLQEAVLQHLASTTLATYGCSWCIPKVLDVFWNDKKIWFSMEKIHGVSVEKWFSTSSSPDHDFFLFLAHVSLVLACLETELGLDHRDMKADNLLLVDKPCKISLRLYENVYTLICPFQIILLDFGFACLGSKEKGGIAVVNLGDGVLPPLDPCPKEGRDLFQLLVSLLRLPSIQSRLSKKTHDLIDSWLTVGSKQYGQMARRWSTENWTYLVASQTQFQIPSCCPIAILKAIKPYLQGSLSSE
jgi:serine/threonine protein kinase